MRNLFTLVFYAIFGCSVVFAQGPPPARVVVDKVADRKISSTQSVIGVLYYERKSEISTEFGGLVRSVEVVEGERVEKGDVLVRLDTEILEREISLTRTRIEQSLLRIENAEKDYRRLEKIFEKAGVSEKVYDDALYTYKDAIKEKRAREDTLEKLLIQKERSVVRAPFDGIILSKDADTGGWVSQGGSLLTLGSSADLYVRAPVAENLLQFAQIGEKVPVVINAFDKRVQGTLVNIDPIADVTTKNVFLKINIPNQPLIAENMSATVHVSSGPERKLRIVKRAALVKHQGKDFVYTIKDGKAAILPVNIVSYLGEEVGVDNDYIVPGMEVVVEGNERLQPDQPVVVAGE